jgi:hypothetical protein
LTNRAEKFHALRVFKKKYSGESRNAGLGLKLRRLFLRGLDIVVTDAEFHYDASFTTVIQPSDSLMAKIFSAKQ